MVKYITSTRRLKSIIIQSFKNYSKFEGMIAWGGNPFDLTDVFKKNISKINRLIIGLHMDQTHPRFIEYFINAKQVKFIKRSSGLFHPKVYYFYNTPNDWIAIVGSNNLTEAAFGQNYEASVVITSDAKNVDLGNQFINAVKKIWKLSDYFSENSLEYYSLLYYSRPKGRFDVSYKNKPKKGEVPLWETKGVRMSWKQYIQRMSNRPYREIRDRIVILDIVAQYFQNKHNLSAMTNEEKTSIAGYLEDQRRGDFKLFGSMKASFAFKRVINQNPEKIDRALDHIPLTGAVTRSQFLDFARAFKKEMKGNKLASATRLLAMKRPDTFLCLDSKNRNSIAKSFGISNIVGLRLEDYWDRVITIIMQSVWYLDPKPTNEKERKISEYRVAFLDAIHYVEG